MMESSLPEQKQLTTDDSSRKPISCDDHGQGNDKKEINTNEQDNHEKDDEEKEDEEEQDTNQTKHHRTTGSSDRPIICQYDSKMGMFRVLRSRGRKVFESGGFGVSIVVAINDDIDTKHPPINDAMKPNPSDHDDTMNLDEGDDDDHDHHDQSKRNPTLLLLQQQKQKQPISVHEQETMATKDDRKKETYQTKQQRFDYLFPEEVVFLHERGFLYCLHGDTSTNPTMVEPTMDSTRNDSYLVSSQLYPWLPSLGISLPVYFSYAHLRAQDFRVLRHHPDRWNIVCQQEQFLQEQSDVASATTTTPPSATSSIPKPHPMMNPLRQYRHDFRATVQSAPPPTILMEHFPKEEITLAWDVYLPNSQFAKTRPGKPDFYVALAYYNVPFFFDQLILLLEQCHAIPLKMATISDSGTVVMFGITNVGVPKTNQNRQILPNKNDNNKDDDDDNTNDDK